MFDNIGVDSRFLKTTGLFAGLLIAITGVLIFLMIEEVEENLEATLLQKSKIRAYQLASTVEEIVLLSGSKRLSELSKNSSALKENLQAIYIGDPSYLYCIVQEIQGRVIFQDTTHFMPDPVYTPVRIDAEVSVDLLTLHIDGVERVVYHLAIPIVIQNQVHGVMKLGISEQELAHQLDRFAGILIRKHLMGVILIVVVGVVAAFQTVRFLREARRIEEQAKETDRLIFLGTIASGLAHEIRNPLNAISIDSELLLEVVQESGEKGRRELVKLGQSIGDSVRYLNATLSSFLQFARPENLLLTPVDLKETVLETVRLVARQCAQQSILIEWEAPDEVSEVSLDVAQFKQALLNLLLNAQQAMPDGGVLVVQIGKRDGGVYVDISDTGIGIPEEDQEKVFNLFYSSKPDGSGLGLGIARKIVEAHHGSLNLTSQPGEGTTFSICLKTHPIQERDPDGA